jgi:hypothetical protein
MAKRIDESFDKIGNLQQPKPKTNETNKPNLEEISKEFKGLIADKTIISIMYD